MVNYGKSIALIIAAIVMYVIFSFWRSNALMNDAVDEIFHLSRAMKPWNVDFFWAQLSRESRQRATYETYIDYVNDTQKKMGNIKSIEKVKCRLAYEEGISALCWGAVVFDKFNGELRAEVIREISPGSSEIQWKLNYLSFNE